MKISLLIVIMAALALNARADDAKTAFDGKNYAAAAKQLETQLAGASPSAEGYANLGLAYQKAGDATQAALNYERALLLDPGLKSAQNAFAEMAPAQHIPLPPRTWRDDINAVAHPDTLVALGTVLFWLGMIGLVLATQITRRRAIANAAAAVALIFGVAAVVVGWLTDPRLAGGKPALVTAKEGADVLTSPSNNSNTILSLPAGSPVRVLSPRGAWTYVDLAGGAKGWVQTDRITPIVPGETL